jgi:hypothetical protein
VICLGKNGRKQGVPFPSRRTDRIIGTRGFPRNKIQNVPFPFQRAGEPLTEFVMMKKKAVYYLNELYKKTSKNMKEVINKKVKLRTRRRVRRSMKKSRVGCGCRRMESLVEGGHYGTPKGCPLFLRDARFSLVSLSLFLSFSLSLSWCSRKKTNIVSEQNYLIW